VNRPKKLKKVEETATRTGLDEQLISKVDLMKRWRCNDRTIERKELAGLLNPVKFNAKMLRYKLSEIEALEASMTVTAATRPKGAFPKSAKEQMIEEAKAKGLTLVECSDANALQPEGRKE
jgi:hypothetical protein